MIELLQKALGQARVDQMIAAGLIEAMPFTYMRGLTFDDAFVIVDEAQNCTYAKLKMMLTRTGERCRVVIDGDIEQTDLREDSGLEVIAEIARDFDIPSTAFIEFTDEDVVRSEMCKAWVQAFADYENDR